MFRRMPFGLVNARATFCRLMRKVLQGLKNCDSFIDDILVFTSSWSEHVAVLTELLRRSRDSGLTARPTKCRIGYLKWECLGHVIGGEKTLEPVPNKVEAIIEAKRPETKMQVRSFLGVVGFYRKFIPNFAAIAAPLTDLTRKGQPNRILLTESHEKAFLALKDKLV